MKYSVILNGETRSFDVVSTALSSADFSTLTTLSSYCASSEDRIAFAEFINKISNGLKQNALDLVIDSADHLKALALVPTYGRVSYNADKNTLSHKTEAGYIDVITFDRGINDRNKANKNVEGYKMVKANYGLNPQQNALVTLFSHIACNTLTESDKAELLRICNKANKGAEQTALKGFYKVAMSDGVPSNKAQADVMNYFYGLFNARTGNTHKAVGSYKVNGTAESITAFELAEKTMRKFNPKKWEYSDNCGNFTHSLYAILTQYINTGKELANKGKGQSADTTISAVALEFKATKTTLDSKSKGKSKGKKANSKNTAPAPAPAPAITGPTTDGIEQDSK